MNPSDEVFCMFETTPKNYQEFLVSELRNRQILNPRFSLRSFAKYLSISPGQLSQLISGKRNLTPKQAQKIAERLGLTGRQIQTLLAPLDKKPEVDHEGYQEIEESQFSLISDWKYYAILSLARINRNNADPEWVANRLGISEPEARTAMERLLEMQYIQRTRTGGFKQAASSLTISAPYGSSEIRKFHHGTLEIAQKKIDEIEPGHRDYSSITLAFPLAKLEKARTMIAEFRRRFATEMEMGDKNQVYTLAIQFFPLTKLQE
jgi:transcriptional regulator with XRE-family HTH domain